MGYGITYALSLASLAAIVVAIGSAVRTAHDGDPDAALDHEGTYAFAFAILLQFIMRLCFLTSRLSVQIRNLVRIVLRVVAVLELLMALAALALIVATARSAHYDVLSSATWFGIPAILGQVCTVLWLIRYSGEPDRPAP